MTYEGIKRHRKVKRVISALTFIFLFGLVAAVAIFTSSSSSYNSHQTSGRSVLAVSERAQDNGAEGHRYRRSIIQVPPNCTSPSAEDFPPDIFTQSQRLLGAVIVHILAAVYIFAVLAVVCDEYFVSSLEKICEVIELNPDVAGATFMAAGSSAPELFTSIIGVFITHSDVGVGTIVGSAVFNVLFIIAIVGLFAGMIVELTWWPLLRDTVCYTITVLVFIIVIIDEKIHWYEALIMLIIYGVYIFIMYWNQELSSYFIPSCTIFNRKHHMSSEVEKSPLLASSDQDSLNQETSSSGLYSGLTESYIAPLHEYESPLSLPETNLQRVFWILLLPATFLLVITIPDCRRPGRIWQKLFFLTFTMSIVWIALLSYLMVWMVSIIGDTFHISSSIMGLTLLAAGTSIPDALASLFVARDGYGDMAVSNVIGSNIFDILVGLGFPWLLQTGIIDSNSVVFINSSGLSMSAITLLGTVIFMLVAIIVAKWRLNKTLGAVFLAVYAIFITLSCLYETNVFGDFSLPPCNW